jgi:RNA polymerase sigma-70 factor, ECF subfamily
VLSVRQAPLREVAPSDEVLVARVRGGSEDAFRQLYFRYARYIAGVVVRMMGDDLELEDVVQDTFVRAAERIDSLRSPAHVRPWLVTIAVRYARERLGRRRRRGLLRQEASHHFPTMSDPRDRARADDLYAALDQLPEKYRIPWFLARIEGEKLEDVAIACGISLATVKRRIQEAQTRLDRRLEVRT